MAQMQKNRIKKKPAARKRAAGKKIKNIKSAKPKTRKLATSKKNKSVFRRLMALLNKSKKQKRKKAQKANSPNPGVKKRKNISKNITNGRIVRTRDEFFEEANGFTKPDHPNKNDYYRAAVVVDSNKDGDLGLVKLTKSSAGKEIAGYKKGKSKYRPYLYTKDNEGNAIRIGKKFKEMPPKDDIPKNKVNEIKKELFVNSSRRLKKENKRKARELKGR